MSIAKKATIFAIAWFLIYILAYFLFIAPHFIQSQNKNNNNNNNQNNNNNLNTHNNNNNDPLNSNPNHHSRLTNVVNTIHDPFVPEECFGTSFFSNLYEKINIGLVIVVHDENPNVILRTVDYYYCYT